MSIDCRGSNLDCVMIRVTTVLIHGSDCVHWQRPKAWFGVILFGVGIVIDTHTKKKTNHVGLMAAVDQAVCSLQLNKHFCTVVFSSYFSLRKEVTPGKL